MSGAMIVVVWALAVARLTRLVTVDKITQAPRRAVVIWAYHRAFPYSRGSREDLALAMGTNADDPPMLAYLVNCPWCVSIWIGAALAPVAYFWGARPWALVPALALAASYVTGFLVSREG